MLLPDRVENIVAKKGKQMSRDEKRLKSERKRHRKNQKFGGMKAGIALLLACCMIAGTFTEGSALTVSAKNTVSTESIADTQTTESTITSKASTEAMSEIVSESTTEAGKSTATSDTESERITKSEQITDSEQLTESENSTESEQSSEEGFSLFRMIRRAFGRSANDSNDVTYDTDQISLTVSDLKFLNASGNELKATTTKDSEKNTTTYDLSGGSVSIYDISKLQFDANFSILKDDATRTIKEGNYIAFQIPEGFDASGMSGQEVKVNGSTLVLAKFQVVGAELRMVFTNNVAYPSPGYKTISGGMTISMTFNKDNSSNRDVTLLEPNGNVAGIALKLPADPTVVSGIDKGAGEFDGSTGTITWKIEIGTETSSKGVSLAGLKITDTPSDTEVSGTDGETITNTYQYFPTNITDSSTETCTYKLTDANGTDHTANVTYAQDDGKLTFTINNTDALTAPTAPATLTVTTGVTTAAQGALSKADTKSLTVYNAVTMESTNATLTVDDSKASAQNSATLNLAASQSKSGKAIDSHTIEWTVKVNEKQNVASYCTEVVDSLGPEFQFVEGSLVYYKGTTASGDGTAPTSALSSKLETSDGWTTEPQYYVSTYSETDGQKIYFYLPKVSPKKDAYIIKFRVKQTDKYTEDTATDGEVKNTVTVKSKLPTYSGNGPNPIEWDFGTPEGSAAFGATMVTKTASADETTGLITWEVYPSTRVSSWSSAVITDAIVGGLGDYAKYGEQSYVADSAKIISASADASDTTATSLSGANIAYDEGTKTLTATIQSSNLESDKKLADYKLVYRTSADAFLHSNGKTKTFYNSATVTIDNNTDQTATGATKVDMKNDFLTKSEKVEYDSSGTPYFHYTITANSDYLSLTNLSIADAISEIVFYDATNSKNLYSNESEKTNAWKFDTTMMTATVTKYDTATGAAGTSTTYGGATAIESYIKSTNTDTNDGASATLDESTISISGAKLNHEKLVLDVYVCPKDTTDLLGADLRDMKISAQNTAKVGSDEVYDGISGTPFEGTSAGTATLNNASTSKSIGKTEGTKTTWQVIINPNGGELKTGAYVLDSIDKTQKYDADSVKLCKAKFTAEGTSIAAGDAVDAKSWSKEIKVTETGRTLQVNLPTGNGAYVLTYDTIIVDTSAKTVKNSIKLHNGDDDYAAATGERKQSGGSWGTLSSVGDVTVQALDITMLTEKTGIKLKGAKVGIYRNQECTDEYLEDIGTTDENGIVTFYGLNVPVGSDSETYYVKVVEWPKDYEGYQEEAQKVTVTRNKTTSEILTSERKPTAQSVSLTKAFKYYDTDSTGEGASETAATGKTATFTLSFYPTGRVKTLTETVYVTGSDGVYTYASKDTNGATTKITSKSDGTLTITGLPWGEYGLKESESADGFAIDSAIRYFEMKYDSTSQASSVVYYASKTDTTGSAEPFSLTNYGTRFLVRDVRSADDVTYISGITVQILDSNGDIATDALNGDAKYEWTTGTSDHAVYNLPAGTYKLHVVTDSLPDYFMPRDDVTFTVKNDGTVTLADGQTALAKQDTASVSGTSGDTKLQRLTIWNDTLSINVSKVDQYGDAVIGAKMQAKGKLWGGTVGTDAQSMEKTWTTAADTAGAAGAASTAKAETIEYLLRGATYTISETDTPDDYLQMSTVKLSVDSEGVISLVDSTDSTNLTKLKDLPGKDDNAYTANSPYYDATANTLFVVDERRPSVGILKQTDWDETGNTALSAGNYAGKAGVTFTLKGELADGTTEKELTTPASGRIYLQEYLQSGKTYTLEETAPTGYESVGKITFNYRADADDASAEIADNPDTARVSMTENDRTITILNTSAQNTSLVFKVIDCTDKSGLVGTTFTLEKKNASGTYEAYGADNGKLTTQSAGQSYDYTVAGAEKTYTTKAGECFVAGLTAGDYRLTQTSTASGYDYAQDNPITITFTVGNDAKNQIIRIDSDTLGKAAYSMSKSGTPQMTEDGICNKRLPGTLTLTKVEGDSGNNEKLDSVEYTLYRKDEGTGADAGNGTDSGNRASRENGGGNTNGAGDYTKVASFKTGNNYTLTDGTWTETSNPNTGKLTLSNLEWGKYLIKETKALSGYKLDDTEYTFEIGNAISSSDNTAAGNAGSGSGNQNGNQNGTTENYDEDLGTLKNYQIQLTVTQTTKNGSTSGVRGRMRMMGRFRSTVGTGTDTFEWEANGIPYEIAGLLVDGEEYTLEQVSGFNGYETLRTLRLRYNSVGSVTLLSSDADVELVTLDDGSIEIRQVLTQKQTSGGGTNAGQNTNGVNGAVTQTDGTQPQATASGVLPKTGGTPKDLLFAIFGVVFVAAGVVLLARPKKKKK